MNALRLVLAQWVRRPLQTALVVVLLALGVATLLALAAMRHQLTEQLTRDARGFDVVVGAKGSPLQLILSALYHVDMPTGNVPYAALEKLRAHTLVKIAIPVSIGDNYRGFRIVGTEAALVDHYGVRLSRGALWTTKLEAVVGAEVAHIAQLAVGSTFSGTHGLALDGFVHEDSVYRVVGVLAPTGTVLDRLILTDLSSVWYAHEGVPEDASERELLNAEREVTAILVQYASPLAAAMLPRAINADPKLMAAVPAAEVARLFSVVGVAVDVMRAFALALVAASILVLFVALMNALEERRDDFAVMRLLGASRGKVVALLLLETWGLVFMAIVLGAAVAVAVLHAVSAWLAQARSFTLSPWTLAAQMGWVPLLVLGASTAAAAVPAWRIMRIQLHDALSQAR